MIKEGLKIFISFIHMKRNDVIFYVVSINLFLIVMFLYNVNLSAVIYASGIWLFISLLFLSFSFYKYYIQVIQLKNCNKHKVFMENELPLAKNSIEDEYQNLITKMNSDNQELRTSFDQKQRDTEDYYTLWTHQVKTPIAASKLLMTNDMTPQSINQLKQELQKIESYVESALYFARLDSMNQDFDFGQVDLDVIIKTVVRKYSTFFIYKKIQLIYKPITMKVVSDQKWLMFVIEQLLTNALKYTREGSITINYNSDRNVVELIDTGIGINEEDIAQVFNKGFTGFNGRMDKSSTGIGLYLCDQIVKKLGHDIQIESQVDIGTKVSLCLDNNSYLTKM